MRSYNTILNKFWNFSCSVDEIAEDQACLDETDEVQKHRVCILGTNDVGKTSLVNQFLTSEYMNTYDASLGMLCLCSMYCIVYRIITHSKERKGKHQNWVPFILSLILMGMKEKKYRKKNRRSAIAKKLRFSISPILKSFELHQCPLPQSILLTQGPIHEIFKLALFRTNFLLHPHENQSKLLWVEILMITLV